MDFCTDQLSVAADTGSFHLRLEADRHCSRSRSALAACVYRDWRPAIFLSLFIAYAIVLWERYAACEIVIGLFLLLRTLQDVSLKVLTVELVVGAAVGAAVVALHGAQPRAGLARLALATLASVLAFAGLVF